MNRLGIFVFFDREGIADDYVFCLLDSMQNILNRLVVVVNGAVDDASLKKFRRYTEYVVIRENRGYDAGAYREVILDYALRDDWKEWDELVLFNDTFYGPFFSWDIVFDKMDGKEVDFWGLSKWLKGKSSLFEEELDEHLQGYFLAVKKKMLSSKAFLDFWHGLEDITTYEETIYRFEVMFTVYHRQYGFRYASWLDTDEVYTKSGQVVYCSHPYDLIKDCSFPVLKRKAVTAANFSQAGAALRYLEDTYVYDTGMIWKHLRRTDKSGDREPFAFYEIEDFVNTHKDIYIYGYGKWGRALESLFAYKGWKFQYMIDAAAEKQSARVRRLSDIQIEEKDGIIVALRDKAFKEVYPQLALKFKKQQMLLPFSQRDSSL